MNRLLPGVVLLLIQPASAHADELLSWLSADGKNNVVLHPPGKLTDKAVVQVTGDAKTTVTRILEVERPNVPSHKYILRGRVKYENVEGSGFVEMLNFFPGEGPYFSRTVADSGPLGKLAGTSDWRDIALPFTSKPGSLPTKITVSVNLIGKGTVHLEALTLSDQETARAGWWSEADSGWYGGGVGSLIGVIGAAFGILAGLGMARAVVMTIAYGMVILGAVTLFAGIVAISSGQPYHVYYPLLLIGGISACVFGFNIPGVKKRYQQQELQRMSAMDA